MRWNKYATQKSATISLNKGTIYVLEALHFENGGQDSMSVGISQNNGEITLIKPNTNATAAITPPPTMDSQKDSDNDGVADTLDKFSFDSSRNGINDNEFDLNKTVIQGKCLVCHNVTGVAKNTDLIFAAGNTATQIFYNEGKLSFFITDSKDGDKRLLGKARGLNGHGGGKVLSLGSKEHSLLEEFVNLFSNDTNDNMSSDGTYIVERPSQTYRRASLYLKGEIPSRSKLDSLNNASDTQLRTEILALMQGDSFHNFIKDGANDRLHSRHLVNSNQGVEFFRKFYTGDKDKARLDMGEEPLELIAYIVENNRPYSEILTANYTMVSQHTDEVYKNGKTVSAGQWQTAQNKGHQLKTEDKFNTDADGNMRIQDYPHAGVLSTWAYNSQYPTTATNRNRARASWTMKHFLGFDIEKSAARVLDIADVADEGNPTLTNPACTSCHQTLDPIAGTFKYFHERVGYKAYGMDSLDDGYRKAHPSVDWYQDMLPAGYRDDVASQGEDPLQWMAKQLVADYRFATGAVKFWWPAVFGEEVLDESAPRTQYDAQEKLINRLANDFRNHLNLKYLLADMMLSDQFRVEKKADPDQMDEMVSLHTGARHLLTGKQLLNKTLSLTGHTWDESKPKLLNDYNLLYGGIDSITVMDRARDMSSLMYRVAERQALTLNCSIIRHDFDKSKGSRRLFIVVERDSLDESLILTQIVVLHERLYNREISATSVEAIETYQLFQQLRSARIARGGSNRLQENFRCDYNKGASDDDKHYVLGPWRGVLAAMMMHPDYLYE